MKANQLIAGTLIAAGLIFGAAAQAQGLGGLGGHAGGALGGAAGGGLAGFNGMGNMNAFGSATRTRSQDVPTGTASAAKSHTTDASGKLPKLQDAVPAAPATAQGSAAAGAARTPGNSTPSASAAAAQSASQTTLSQGSAQLAGGANASKSGVDADASGQGAANRGGINATGGASASSSAGR